jgi:hypothetical protein
LHGISSKNTEECKNIDLIMVSGTNYNWLYSSAATLLSIKIEKCKKQSYAHKQSKKSL